MYTYQSPLTGPIIGPGGTVPSSPFSIPGVSLPSSPGEWIELAPAVVDAWNAFSGEPSGSSGCWAGYDNRPLTQPCPGTPSFDAIYRAVETAPDSQIQKLVAYLKGGNQGKGPRTRAELMKKECLPNWAKAIMGGKGCVASTYPEAPAWFRNFVGTYGAPKEEADTFPGSALLKKDNRTLLALAAAGVVVFFVPRLLGKG